MWKSVGTARWVYNWTLSKQEENYKNGGKFIPDGELRKELTRLKKTEEYSWLQDVSNNVAKQSVKDACDAYIYACGVLHQTKVASAKSDMMNQEANKNL